MIVLSGIFILCLIFSAFFSGAEMAFVSANKLKLRNEADEGSSAAKKIVKLQKKPQNFLTSVLIGNNIVNVVATSILTYVLLAYFKIQNELVVTLIMSPIIIVFCETVPKEYCRLQSHNILIKLSGILNLLVLVMKVPADIISAAIHFLFPVSHSERKKRSIFVSEAELRSLIEESTEMGVLESHEKKLIDTILDFERTKVSTVMVPLEQVPQVDLNSTVGEVKEAAKKSQSRMFVVYEEIPSIIVGMVYVFDLLFEENENLSLGLFLRSPVFLPKDASVEKAFYTLQQRRQSYAMIIDKNREVVGVVPIERLLSV